MVYNKERTRSNGFKLDKLRFKNRKVGNGSQIQVDECTKLCYQTVSNETLQSFKRLHQFLNKDDDMWRWYCQPDDFLHLSLFSQVLVNARTAKMCQFMVTPQQMSQ